MARRAWLLLALAACAQAPQTTYFPSGKRRQTTGFDARGRAEGRWVGYYPTGEIRELGQHRSDRREGEWTTYHPGGALHARGRRQWNEAAGAALREGSWTQWYSNGYVAWRGTFRAGLREGPFEYWDADGRANPGRSGIYADDRKVAELPQAPPHQQGPAVPAEPERGGSGGGT